MIYSVFSWKDGLYHYYKGPGEERGNRPKPRVKVNAPNGNGVQLEALLPVLPANAIHTGQGTQPQGRIAIPSTEVAPLNTFTGTGRQNPFYHSPWLTLTLWVGGLYLLTAKVIPRLGHYLGDKYYD